MRTGEGNIGEREVVAVQAKSVDAILLKNGCFDPRVDCDISWSRHPPAAFASEPKMLQKSKEKAE